MRDRWRVSRLRRLSHREWQEKRKVAESFLLTERRASCLLLRPRLWTIPALRNAFRSHVLLFARMRHETRDPRQNNARRETDRGKYRFVLSGTGNTRRELLREIDSRGNRASSRISPPDGSPIRPAPKRRSFVLLRDIATREATWLRPLCWINATARN